MNLKAPVSSIMTKKLITCHPNDAMKVVQEIFETNKIHHIPVVKFKEIVGLVSRTDYMHFLRGGQQNNYDKFLEQSRLKNYTVKEVMTTGLAKLSSSDKIDVALEVFMENLFHAIPVVDDGELVGLLTTFDILRALSKDDAPVEQKA